MGSIKLLYKVLICYITGNIVRPQDIGISYDLLSDNYDERFLTIMHKYNIAMLSELRLPEHARILDLACGTGFNSKWLLKTNADYKIDAVDISQGMLNQAHKNTGKRVKLFNASMLDFLVKCRDEQYDIIVCSWALKYQSPKKILYECERVLKPGGQIGIIVNTKNTLPEIRKIYKYLLLKNSTNINKLMLELPNPKGEKQFGKWFNKAGFKDMRMFSGLQKFSFDSKDEMADWVTTTGALAGFDIMLDLHAHKIKNQIVDLIEAHGISSVTHDFVWGVAEKC